MNKVVRKYCNWVRSVLPLFVAVVMVSCLKETPMPVVIDFEAKSLSGYSTAPYILQLTNNTSGADFYEWSFEGAEPATSSERVPRNITFSEVGEHTIRLRAWNATEQASDSLVIRVDSAVVVQFDIDVITNNFAPAQFAINNRTVGATSYEWFFSGATVQTSSDRHPEAIVINTPGEHRVVLRASNGNHQKFEAEQLITVEPKLSADFSLDIDPKDIDMEAPLTATLSNTSISYINTEWSCSGAQIDSPKGDTTQITFNSEGRYTITMATDNNKESDVVTRELTVLPNSGIRRFNNVELGIYQDRNIIGSLFSAELGRTIKSNEVSKISGEVIDFGFYGLNANFDYCYFFSPDRAEEASFTKILGATTTYCSAANISELAVEEFNAISNQNALDNYTFPTTHSLQTFSLSSLPQFYALQREDGRRVLIHIKDVVNSSDGSFIVVDIIIEKRDNE